jgi:hypothetical protein
MDSGMEDAEAIETRLAAVRDEHRDLDDSIALAATSPNFDELALRRLKKRKLVLKDLIARLESARFPDIIA